MSSTGSDSVPFDDGDSWPTTVSSKLMIAAIAFFFFVVVFVALLDHYVRRRWGGPGVANSHHLRRRTRSRLVFRADHDDASAPRGGLSAEVLKALPIRIYRSSDFEKAIDCAVCLSELVDGDKVRLLPPCQHCFHVDCIDMWFHSHSTCPLCRNSVTTTDIVVAAPLHDISTDALPCGPRETRDLSSTNGTVAPVAPTVANERALVIEIPRRALDTFTSMVSSPLPTSRRVEDMKSPTATSATPSKLRSLKRILSRENRTMAVSSCGSPCGGGVGDLEMGLTGPSTGGAGGSGVAKTSHKNL